MRQADILDTYAHQKIHKNLGTGKKENKESMFPGQELLSPIVPYMCYLYATILTSCQWKTSCYHSNWHIACYLWDLLHHQTRHTQRLTPRSHGKLYYFSKGERRVCTLFCSEDTVFLFLNMKREIVLLSIYLLLWQRCLWNLITVALYLVTSHSMSFYWSYPAPNCLRS